MAKAKASKPAKKKTNTDPGLKPKSSKIQKASQAPPATQDLRRSRRLPKKSSRAQEADSNAPPPTRKPKIGLKNKNIAEPSEDADADPSVDTITNAPPPTKKPKTRPTIKPTRLPDKGVNNRPIGQVIQDAIEKTVSKRSSHPFEGVKTRPQNETTRHSSDNAGLGPSTDTARKTATAAPAGKTKTGPKDAMTRESPRDLHTGSSDHADADTNAPPTKKKAKTNTIRKAGSGTSDNNDAGYAIQSAATGTLAAHAERETTRQRLRQEGWDITEVPGNFRRCYVPNSRLPSPFVSVFGDRQGELRDVLNTYVNKDVTRLWSRARRDRERVSLRMAQMNAISNDGRFGRFCALAHVGAENLDNSPDHDGSGIVVYGGGDDNPFSIQLDALKPDIADANSNDTGKTLEVRRLINTQTNKYGYFVVNPNLESLAINESAVSTRLIAGPLPEFAVFSIDDVALFWFRTRKAVDEYLPERRVSAGIKRKRSDAPPPITWETIMNDGIEKSRRLYGEALGALRNDPVWLQIRDAANMTLDDVWVAIGSVWEGLRSGTPKSSRDAYAGMDVFYPPDTTHYTPRPDQVAGWEKRFFMPILFAAENDAVKGKASKEPSHKILATKNIKGKGEAVFVEEEEEEEGEEVEDEEDEDDEVGHLLLAVAHIVGKPREIQLAIYDSSEIEVAMSHRHTLHRARDLIKRAQWPSPNAETALKYRNSIYYKVPQQRVETNTCGLYTILNAWALMLGIPIQHQNLWRPGESAHEQFVKAGLEVINLALAGFMDSRTIQAFMNVHGYCEQQSPANLAERAIPADAVAMEQTRLDRKLRSQRHVDLGISEGRSNSPDEMGPPGSPVDFSEENVTTLMEDMFVTREEAVTALTRSRNNLDAAAGFILEDAQNSGLSAPGQPENSQDPDPPVAGQPGHSRDPDPPVAGQPGHSRDPEPPSSAQSGTPQNPGLNGNAGQAASIVSFPPVAPWDWFKKRKTPNPGRKSSD